MKASKAVFLLILMATNISSIVIAQDLILSAPPRETEDNGKKQYGPIARYLSELLGVTVKYEHPSNWLNYQREMRNDKYDIVFDGPHFIAWREAHLGHEAILKLPGKLQFILVIDKKNTTLNKPEDLIGKNICGISPPNLSTLSVLDHYRNPVRQPVIVGIKGGMGKVFKTFLSNDKVKCDAAVLRTAFHDKKLKSEQREMLKILFTSKAMPNQGISLSKRISPELKLRIKNGLTDTKGIESTKGVLKRFGGKAKSFILAETGEYAGYNNLLEGVIFGW